MFEVITGGLAVLFAAAAVLLLSGRGAFLIAGYNTAGEEEQKKYDRKKLCRVMGTGMLILAILLAILTAGGKHIQVLGMNLFFLVVLVDIAVLLYLTNTRCYADGVRRKLSLSNAVVILIFLIMGVVFSVISFTGDVTVTCSDQTVSIHATYWSGTEIARQDIAKTEWRDSIDGGDRSNGFGSARLQLGTFDNQEFGKYSRYTYTQCDACVVLTLRQGRTVVINGRDTESTRQLYDELQQTGEQQ